MFSIALNKHDICISIVTRGVFSRSVAVCGLCNKSLNAAHAWNCGKSLHCVAVVLLWPSVMSPHHTEHSHHALYTGASALTKATWEIEICETSLNTKAWLLKPTCSKTFLHFCPHSVHLCNNNECAKLQQAVQMKGRSGKSWVPEGGWL